MFFEPNNSCAVLNYVKTHFQCNTRDLVDPGYTRNFPVLTLPIPGDDGNNDLPDEDGPYNENDRKPIWWYHSDHLGSSTYLTDNFGRPSHYYETLPFGEMIVEHNQSSFYDNAYKFNGKELDEATGMYYYGARYYDPRISIFVSVDPLAEEFVGWTPYHYVHNNPINLVDPTGMSAENGEGGGFFSRAWNAIKNTFNPSSTDEDMTILDEIVINTTRKTKEERIKEKQIATIKSHWKSEQIKDEWREMGIWDDNISYDNYAHAVGSQLSLTMPSARFNGLFNFFSKESFTVKASKFDYFFGRVVSGPQKNIDRSAQNLKDLTTLGVKNEAQLTKLFRKAFKNEALSTITTLHGTTVVKSVKIGNKGAIEVGFFYQGSNMKSIPSVSSIIPKIYK